MPEEVLNTARSTINPEDLHAEDLLDEIHHQRNLSRKARESAESANLDAEKLRQELNLRLENIENERIAILEEARQEAQTEIETLQAELKTIRRQMNRSKTPVKNIKPLEEKMEQLEAAAKPPVERRRQPSQPAPRPLLKGARVFVRSLNMEGRVLSVGEEDVEVQLGTLRLRANLSDIQRPGEPAVTEDKKNNARKKAAPEPETQKKEPVLHPSPGMELDLRGTKGRGWPGRIRAFPGTGLPVQHAIHPRHPRERHWSSSPGGSKSPAPFPIRFQLVIGQRRRRRGWCNSSPPGNRLAAFISNLFKIQHHLLVNLAKFLGLGFEPALFSF